MGGAEEMMLPLHLILEDVRERNPRECSLVRFLQSFAVNQDNTTVP